VWWIGGFTSLACGPGADEGEETDGRIGSFRTVDIWYTIQPPLRMKRALGPWLRERRAGPESGGAQRRQPGTGRPGLAL
jgi:hypothetical protein